MHIITKHFPVVLSTQSVSQAMAEELPLHDWLVVTADEQTGGRGTANKSWYSPAQVNLYATFNLHWSRSQSHLLFNLPQVVALAIVDVLQAERFQPRIKWINDVYLSRKKVTGILCESQPSRNYPDYLYVSIGIGLNTNMTQEMCHNVTQPVTSLYLERGERFNNRELVQSLQQRLMARVELLQKQGFAPCYPQINHLLEFMGEQVTIVFPDQPSQQGIVQGINHLGQLLLQQEEGVLTLSSGSMKIS